MTIPENVIEVLASIRESGKVDMRENEVVIQIADVMDEGAADWLRENPNLYMDALNEMGARVNGGDEE